MPEWSIGAVSKTVERFAFQGFESLSFRINGSLSAIADGLFSWRVARERACELSRRLAMK